MNLRILSVNIGRPRIIGYIHGEPVRSGIAKAAVSGDSVFVGEINIHGDAQADLSVHGGPDKAVYAYPADHWRWWESEHSLACAANTFGENLTLEGADETQVSIGDRFRWGACILEVSQPRGPCYKLALHTQRADTPTLMALSGRCGWYLRVIAEGDAPTAHGTIERIHESGGPNVRDSFFAAYDPRMEKARKMEIARAPALAREWRGAVLKRLGISR
ncbi:MAG TPA: MOSC domain-containing protein [Rhizomicrobium sp.]|jgi:MOSC domain-containing protein YiiM|nr:MOSC domain-containing protein [Rhizomicrobium sp.]